MTNKLYHQEEIVFYNDHKTQARPLPIKKLKLLQKVFDLHIKDQRKATLFMRDVMDQVKAMEADTEKEYTPQELEEFYEARQAEVDEMDLIDWNEVLIRGSLIALDTWGVKDEAGHKLGSDTIDREYVEDTLDVPTAQRICEIAGNFKVGELDQSSPGDSDAEGKAPAAAG